MRWHIVRSIRRELPMLLQWAVEIKNKISILQFHHLHLPHHPKLTIPTMSIKKKIVKNNVPVLTGVTKANNLTREMNKLHNETRDRSNEYLKKCSGNRLIHWDSLKSLICTSTVCNQCGSSVYIDGLTTGIATQIKLTCQNQRCTSKNLKNEVKRTIFKKEKVRVNDPAESYAINCQFVLCLIQNGCGSTEGESLMTYLDLPNAPSFKKKTFARIQEKMRP